MTADGGSSDTAAVSRIRRVIAVVVAVLCSLGMSFGVTRAPASAAFWPAGIDVWVMSEGMGPIKTRVFRARDHNTRRVVYALDGMRARSDLNGWEIETSIAQELTARNINVVMPVGGMSSFYSDWSTPSNFGSSSTGSGGSGSSGSAGYPNRAVWETFLTRELPGALQARFKFQRVRNGVFGVSMGGGAALDLAAYHPDQFSFAGSLSGFLDISRPLMPEAIRLAMLDAGDYNIDDMWGPARSALWLRNDPMVFATRLRDEHIPLFVGSGNGVPSADDGSMDPFDNYIATLLEQLALQNTQAFRQRLLSLGYQNVVYDFAPVGLHNWHNWAAQVDAMLPDLGAHIG